MNWRICFTVILTACGWPLVVMAQNGTGSIWGCVTDTTATGLPGVKVLLTKGDTTTQVVTDSSGCYDATNLGPGTYRVFACLAGFQTLGRDELIIAQGRFATLDFQLRVGPICECIHIPTLGALWQAADVVVRVRLIGQRLDPKSDVSATVVHTAKILTTWKSDAHVSGDTITFLQPLEGECEPFAIGREFVLFLRWDTERNAFERVNRENGAFTIENGRITWAGVDEYYGQTTAAFLAAVEVTKQRAGQ